MDIHKLEDLTLADSSTKVRFEWMLTRFETIMPKLTRLQEANPMAQFSALPAELHLRIASKCSSNALAALCRTSRLFHDRCTEKLYRNVDLGRRASQREGDVYYNQSSFLRTLKRHPEYARYIQKFRWPLVVLKLGEVVDNLPHLPSYSKRNPRGIWEILQLLTEVISVEIEEGNTDGYPRAMVPQGLSLFPKATSITMFGVLIDTLVHAVLPVVKARQLQHLGLYHVRLEAPVEDIMEPTIKFLSSLTGKCTSLKSLEIVESNDHVFEPCGALGEATASTAYMKFLESVKETLVAFRFICKDVGGSQGDPDDDVLEMTSNIHRVLNRGTWPHLRKVTTMPILYSRVWNDYDDSDSELIGV